MNPAATLGVTEQEQTLATLQRLAHLHNDRPGDWENAGRVKIVAAIYLQTDEFPWDELTEAEQTYHSLVEMGDRPNGEGPYERDLALQHLAAALWRMTSEGTPCRTCITTIPGAPWEIAARTGSALAGGRCARHVRQVAA